MVLWLFSSAWAAWEPKPELVPVFNEAVSQLKEGELEPSLKTTLRLLSRQPDCGIGALLEAQVLVRLGRLVEARALAEQLSSEHPAQLEVWQVLSEVSFLLQDFDRSLTAAQSAIRLSPADFWSQVLLQRCLLRRGEYEAALQALESSRRLAANPGLDCLEVSVWADQGNVEKALLKMEGCERASDVHLVRQSRLVVAAMRGDKGAAAEAAYSAGDDEIARLHRAGLRMEENDADGCLAELLPLLTGPQMSPSVRLMIAHCLRAKNLLPEAEEQLQSVFSADNWVNIQSDGRISGVLTMASQTQFWTDLRRGAEMLVEIQLSLQKLEKAEQTAARMRSHFGDQPEVAAAEAEVTFAKGQDPWPALAAALEQWPTDPTLRVVMTDLLPYAAAPASVVELVHQSPQWEDHYNLSQFYYHQRRFSDCLTELSPVVGNEKVLILQYECAAAAEDLAVLDRLRANNSALLKEQVIPSIRHAWLLVQAGRKTEAKELLDLVCVGSVEAETCGKVRERLK